MEVQKHPHHVTHKKKWFEYTLEFLMLFLAVFLGFIAENFRESIFEQHREKEYIVSLIDDLNRDTFSLNRSIPYEEARLAAIDSVFLFYENHPEPKYITGLIRQKMGRTMWGGVPKRNILTISELKNAGEMRLIKNKIVSDSIASYDISWQLIDFYNNVYTTHQQMNLGFVEKIIQARDLLRFYREDWAANDLPDSATIRINLHYLNEYLNFLHRQKGFATVSIGVFKAQKDRATRLIELIKKEYHIK
ncbi:MAG: hypothetical protein NVS9B7_24950 [Flavisolibacter sp.]